MCRKINGLICMFWGERGARLSSFDIQVRRQATNSFGTGDVALAHPSPALRLSGKAGQPMANCRYSAEVSREREAVVGFDFCLGNNSNGLML